METLSGRYRVGDVVYRDDVVIVHRGHDQTLNRPVTIERLQPHAANPASVAALQEKARRMALSELPNAAALYDQGEEQGRPYLIMEELQGAPLADVTPLAPNDVVTLVAAIAAAIRAAQRAQVPLPRLDAYAVRFGEGRTQIVPWGIATTVPADDMRAFAPLLAIAATGSPRGDAAHPVAPSLMRVVKEALRGGYSSFQALEDELSDAIGRAEQPTMAIPLPTPTVVLGPQGQIPRRGQTAVQPAQPQVTRRRPAQAATGTAVGMAVATVAKRRPKWVLPGAAGLLLLLALLAGASWIRGRDQSAAPTADGATAAANATGQDEIQVDVTPPPSGQGTPYIVAPAGAQRLNVRSGPGENNPVVGRLNRGTTVMVLEGPVRGGRFNWVHVRGNGVEGWCVFEALRPQ